MVIGSGYLLFFRYNYRLLNPLFLDYIVIDFGISAPQSYSLWQAIFCPMELQTLATLIFPIQLQTLVKLHLFLPLKLQTLAFILYAHRVTNSCYLFYCLYNYRVWHPLFLSYTVTDFGIPSLQSYRLWQAIFFHMELQTMATLIFSYKVIDFGKALFLSPYRVTYFSIQSLCPQVYRLWLPLLVYIQL